jgi:hypothetical protein
MPYFFSLECRRYEAALLFSPTHFLATEAAEQAVVLALAAVENSHRHGHPGAVLAAPSVQRWHVVLTTACGINLLSIRGKICGDKTVPDGTPRRFVRCVNSLYRLGCNVGSPGDRKRHPARRSGNPVSMALSALGRAGLLFYDRRCREVSRGLARKQGLKGS